jgi:hypothetical protein
MAFLPGLLLGKPLLKHCLKDAGGEAYKTEAKLREIVISGKLIEEKNQKK